MAELACRLGRPRSAVWGSEGWHDRFGLPYPEQAFGFGMGPNDVAAFNQGDADLLARYHAAVAAASNEVIATLTADDLTRIVDKRWDPPVTAMVRLVSIANDTTQHLGQIAYIRGLGISS